MKSDIAWPADKVERRPIDELREHDRNARTHSDQQVAQIAEAIRQWGWTIPILVDEEGVVIAGHGRLGAARRLGIDEVPVMVARGWSQAQKRAYLIADNKLTENAGWDDDILGQEFLALRDLGFDLPLTGFLDDDIRGLLGELGDEAEADYPGPRSARKSQEDPYTRKIEAPIYEPRGDQPAPSELFDASKTDALVAEIEAADLPDDVREFLIRAAERHTVFDFRRVADFYAQADERVQDLMERSALVIIDFDKAIENGFVRVSQALGYLADGKEPAPPEEVEQEHGREVEEDA